MTKVYLQLSEKESFHKTYSHLKNKETKNNDS